MNSPVEEKLPRPGAGARRAFSFLARSAGATLLLAVGLFAASACNDHQKIADEHRRTLEQEDDESLPAPSQAADPAPTPPTTAPTAPS